MENGEEGEIQSGEILILRINILDTIRKRRLQWAGLAQRNQHKLIKAVMDKNPCGINQWGGLKQNAQLIKKRMMESLSGGSNWKEKAANRKCWRTGCNMGWF